jgi:hypothetical protein
VLQLLLVLLVVQFVMFGVLVGGPGWGVQHCVLEGSIIHSRGSVGGAMCILGGVELSSICIGEVRETGLLGRVTPEHIWSHCPALRHGT